MIDLVDVQSSTFSTASIGTNAIVDGRCRLLMVIARQAHGVAENTASPVSLRTGASDETIRYKFSFPTDNNVTWDISINQVWSIGGSGVLFEDGMYYSKDESAAACADMVTVVYTGGKDSGPT